MSKMRAFIETLTEVENNIEYVCSGEAYYRHRAPSRPWRNGNTDEETK